MAEAAAWGRAQWRGGGLEKKADHVAVEAMRSAFNESNIDGTVVSGEGERGQAPMLYIGEKVGKPSAQTLKVDIALDPLEGTTICANGDYGAISVVAVSNQGGLLHAPDVYMNKLACGPQGQGALNLEWSPQKNLKILSEVLGKSISSLTVSILNRPRHQKLIANVRAAGARIQLIGDGDVSAGIATCWGGSGVDLLLGIGGAPEGVITAAALKCIGGHFQGQLIFGNENEKARAHAMGVLDIDKIYTLEELASGSIFFAATGITDGPLLKGIRLLPNGRAQSHSIVFRSHTGTVRTITADHSLGIKKINLN